MLEKSSTKERETKIKHVGFAAIKVKGRIVTNSVKEAMRVEDAKDSFKTYVKEKFKHNNQFIDLIARNAFKHKEVTA